MAAAAAPAPAPAPARLALDKSQLFGAVVTARHDCSYAATPEHLLVFGGTTNADDTCYLHSFDFSRRLWTEIPLCDQLAGLSDIRSALCMFSPDGTLYFFGGETHDDYGTTDVELSLAFEHPAGAWRVVRFGGELPDCTDHKVAVVGNKAFVVSSNTGPGNVHVLDFSSLCFSRMQTTGLKPDVTNIKCMATDISKKLVYALLAADRGQSQLLTLDTETLTWAAAAPPFLVGDALNNLVVLPDGRVLMTNYECTISALFNCGSGVISRVNGPLASSLLSFDFLCARRSSLFMFSGTLCEDPTCPAVPVVEVALASLVPAAGDVPPPSKLVADLSSLLEPDGATLSDVTFLVEGTEVKAHRAILAARSAYFRGMFLGGCSESGAAGAPVQLSGVTHAAFLLVLQFLYTGAASLTALNAQAALEAASYLQLPDMVEAVVAFIVPSISLDNVVACLMLPAARDSARLRGACIAFLVRELCDADAGRRLMAELRATPNFPSDILCELLEASTLRGGAAANAKRMRINS